MVIIMSKRKPIQSIEETDSLHALIVAEDHQEIVSSLSKILTTRGCQVKVLTPNELLHGAKFDYIFQLGDYSSAINLFHKNLAHEGKFLFVEAEVEEVINKESPPFKMMRIGNSGLWNIKELVDKMLKTIFSTSQIQVVDIRKGHLTKLSPIRPIQSPRPLTPPPQIAVVTKKRTWRNKLVIVTVILLVAILFSTGYVIWSGLLLKNTFFVLKNDISTSNWRGADLNIRKAQKQLSSLKNIYDFSWELFIPLREARVVKDMGVLLAVANNLLTSGGDFVATYNSETPFEISPETVGRSEKKIIALRQTVTDSGKRIDSLSLPYFPKEEIMTYLNSIHSKLTQVTDLIPVGRELFFSDSAKTYLVLFQNNMELRPTGGFIGSFALLTVKDGRMLEFKIMDVYAADGQLKGHVDPPMPIRKHLSQPNWFLRDSNFDPDFAKSAAQSSWFIQKELGRNVDGVIATNLFFVGNLLRVSGPVTLSDFNNETVTADNFFFKAQFYAQNDFFPGSTQKRDFLTNLTNILQLRLTNPQDLPLLSLFSVVKNSLDEKNLLLWSSTESIQKLIEEKGWGGRMVAVECVGGEEKCRGDYLSISEANLGVNKANYFVAKSVAVEKKIDLEGNVQTAVTLSYENRNIAELFSGGSYVNYLRFLLPLAAKLNGLTLNSEPIPLSDIDTQLYGNDKTSYGYLLKLAPENKAVVKITYEMPSFFTNDLESYQFFFQKQAGDKVSPLVLSIIFPEGVKMEPVNFKSTSSRDNELFFTTDTSVDRIFALRRE